MKANYKLILIFSFLNLICGQNVKLTVQNTKSQNGPQIIGININTCLSLDSNWMNFMERLGVNGIRIFISFSSAIKNLVAPTKWGQDLNGASVVDQASFNRAVSLLRSSNGRNRNYAWYNPIYWSQLSPSTLVPNVSLDDMVQKLNKLNISKLFVLGIACNDGTHFQFSTFDRASPSYWSDRWELYKYSYATAILARNYGVSIIEYMNEPDELINPGSCMNASVYLEYYLIRSQSIQEAYNDMNADDPTNKVTIKIAASAFSKLQFGGDPSRFLGDVSVNNATLYFSTYTKNSSWSNMQLYSYHEYLKPGPDYINGFKTLSQSVNAANPTNINLPVIVTEHNSHGGSEWNTTNTTVDTDFEASRLASQIINFASLSSFTQHYVYKFINFEIDGNAYGMRKNGIHWSDYSNGQLKISDTSLAAESLRLLTPLKNSQIYLVDSNDVPNNNFRTYLASSNGDGNFYLYAVNDNGSPVNLNIDLSALNINDKTKILVETVSNNYWGEISSTVSTVNKEFNLAIDRYSTTKVTIQQGSQSVSSTNSALTCTAYAGNLNNNNYCSSAGSNQFIYSGTSNNASHETTSVALIKFPLTTTIKKSQRVLLNITVDSIVGNQSSRVVVLGVRNPSFSLTPTSASWSSLSNLLNPLPSGTVIKNIDQNFINWSSNANLALAGHISASYLAKNQYKMIDVTDYVNQMINSGASQLHFLLYRPFRNKQYSPPGGIIPADDLSSGSLIRINGANSANPPQLLYYNTN